MKQWIKVCAFFFAISLVACGSDDDDDMFGMKQMADEFEDMANSGNSGDFFGSSNSKNKNSSSSGSNLSSEEEEETVNIPKIVVETHYDSTRKVTIGTGKHNDALINYSYRTVQVGHTIWLAENVRRDARTAMCYNDKDSKCETYGMLYQSASGLCPADFRLPRLEEWQELIKTIGSVKSLMSKTLWGDDGESGGKDEIGFTMLPGGICTKGKCSGLGTEANFFTEKGDVRGYVTFKYGKDSLEWHTINNDDDTHLSIRCVQPATTFQKETEIGKTCEPKSEVDVIEGKRHFKCSVDSVWQQVLDSIPSSCSSKDEDKRYLISGSEYLCISGKIRQLTYVEKSLGRCVEKNEGDTARYSGTLYLCQSSEWKSMGIEDLYGKCTSSSNPTRVVQFDGDDYRCKDGQWDTLSVVEKERGFCDAEKEGERAQVQGVVMVPVLAGTVETGLVELKSYRPYYFHYICRNNQWETSTTSEDYFGECTAARQGEVASYLSGFVETAGKITYLCENGKWRIPTKREDRLGFCTKDLENKLVLDSGLYFICKNGVWTEPSIDEFSIPCDKAHLDSVYKTWNHTLVCDVDTLKWREMDYQELKLGLCNEEKEGQTGRPSNSLASYYLCKNRKWVRTDSLNYFLGFCSTGSENYQKVKTHRDKKDYYCNGEKWVVAVLDDILGECTYANERDTVRYKDSLYICKQRKWQKATQYNVLGSCDVNNKGEIDYNFMNHTNYVCDSYAWDIADMNDIETCTASKYGVVKKMPNDDNREFVCSDYHYSAGQEMDRWRQLTPEDSAVGVCSPAQNGVVKEKNSSMYICTLNTELMYASHRWDSPSKKEAMDYKCSSASSGTVINYATQKNICDGKGGWSVEYGSVTIGGVAHKTVDFAGLTILAENLKAPTVNSKCFEGNNNQSCTHGRLYTMVDAYEACPTGWHLMDSVEYKTIENMARNYSGRFHTIDIFDSGNSAWQAASSGKNNDDVYGIGIFGTGYCDATGKCDYSMRESYLWTTDVVDLSTVYAVHHTYERKTEIVRMNPNAHLGARCVKDH